MAPPLIQLKDIALTFGGTPLLSGVELSVSSGERVCLIGRNGSGKSTLLKIAAGTVEPDGGSRFVQPGATIRYLPQEPDFEGFATTLAYVEAGLGPSDDHYQARFILEQLGLHGDEDPAHVSGGEARRAALARVLAPSPDILLLDEPTNHLDLTTIEWLESELGSRRTALVMISHDRRFLSNLSRATAWLDRGQIRQIDRGFSAFEAWRDEVLAEEERDQHKLDRKIVNEEHWLRYGVSGRRKRNVKRLGNLYELRQQRRDYRGAAGNANLAAAEADKSGKLVIEAKNIGRTYGNRKIIDDFSIRVQRGDRIGIVGPNGAGKTTLIEMLTGGKPPDAGTIRFGANLEMATLDQHRESLDPKSTLAEALTGGRSDHVMVGGKPKHVVSYMKDFLFGQEQMRTPLEVLSGGERGRLMLARALAKPSNLLVLDEPTNDLDLETLDLLQEVIADYDGTVLIVSHDRDFLDRTVTITLGLDGSGKVDVIAGGYEDWERKRQEDLRVPAKGATQKRAWAPASAGAPKPTKLSYKDQRDYDLLPARIEQLTAEMARDEQLLSDSDLYTRDPARFAALTAAIGAARTERETAEERWLELAEQFETLASAS